MYCSSPFRPIQGQCSIPMTHAAAHLLWRVCECHLQLLALAGDSGVDIFVGQDRVIQLPETLHSTHICMQHGIHMT